MTEPNDQGITSISTDGTIRSYDSLEAMWDDMSRAEEAAMRSLHPVQRELLGQREFYWIRPYPEMQMFIFGHHNLDDWIALEKSLTPEDEMHGFEPWREQCEDKNLVRGYKSGRCFSPIEPDGEIGDTHVATMWPISKEGFEQAREMGWQVSLTTGPQAGTPLARDFAKLAALAAEAMDE